MAVCGLRPPAELLVIGANHRTSSGSIRDLLCSVDSEMPAIQTRLKAAGLDQFLWLSTCDRVEVVAVDADTGRAASIVTAMLAERSGMVPAALEPHLFMATGEAAVRHLFAVACSLDSQVVGEPHVLGQIKAAHREAVEADTIGPELEAVLQAAYNAAKRVRTETAIAERPVSIAAAAVQIAREIHGDLDRCEAVLIGLGDMGTLMADSLRDAGVTRLTVADRVDRRAEAAARRLDGHYVPMADLENALAAADIVVTAAGLGRYILALELMTAVLRRRRRRPVFVIDTAIPGDVDPAVGDLEGAFVYDLADLERVALEGRAVREAAAVAAWAIVDEALAAFRRGRLERAAVPAVAALRRHFETERARLLAEQGSLDAAEATRLLVNRLLHPPSEMLRAMAAARDCDQPAVEKLLRRLFRLDEDERGDPAIGSDKGEVR
jgi:glutamyl-tRNA reductase